jgi:arabinan endo-1,5-alpha-L-arabinosidase
MKDINPKPGLWAPAATYFGGQWHLYYSVSTFGSQRSAIGMATNPTLDPQDKNYHWTDRGKVLESFPKMEFNAIDPTIVIDADGTPWMAFGSWNRGIYVVKLDAESGQVATHDMKPHHIAARPKVDAMEAPDLFLHDGWYYLLTSWDLCCRGRDSTYKLMIGRSRNITGPYLDKDSRPLLEGFASPFMASHDFMQGPGQSSVVHQGKLDWLCHHYYDLRSNGVPTVAVRPIKWDDEGWPAAGEAVGEGKSQ